MGTIVSLEIGAPLEDYIVVATAYDEGWEELGKQAEIAVGIAPGAPRQRTGSDGR